MAGVSFPPCGPLEIVFSFDTTGSMSSILDEVRGRLQDMIQRLQSDIHGIRIGVIAHGDYCDKDVFYLTNVYIDLCQNVAELCQFVQDIEGTGGGDADECYELILRIVRQNFSWTMTGSQKILVMIGDANPHEPDYELNTVNINWREELKAMKEMGIKVYGVQVFDHEGVDAFYKTLATETDGHYLKLTEFSNICDLMMAICYAERGEHFLMNYENEVRLRFGGENSRVDNGKILPLPKDLEGMFGTLRREDSTRSMASITPVTTPPAVPPKPIKIARVKPLLTGKVKGRKPNYKVKNKVKTNDRPDMSQEFRENVSTKTFDSTCKCQTSTRWRMVYSNMFIHIKPNLIGWKFQKLKDDSFYWKKTIAFPKLCNDQGIYELAVQTKPKCKLHVVYSFTVNSTKSQLMKTRNWESALFRSRYHRRKMMTNIIKAVHNGCLVFLRRIRYSKKTDLQIKQFNYAWTQSRARHLVKNRVVISGQTDHMDTS